MKYFLYLRLMLRQRQWRTVFFPGDIALAIVGLFLIIMIPDLIESAFDDFRRNFFIVLSCLLLVAQFFTAVDWANRSIHIEKVIFFKTLGFKKLDFFLLILHSFLFLNFSFSIFLWTILRVIFYDASLWLIPLLFIINISAVCFSLLLISIVNRKGGSAKRKIRNSHIFFSNKYFGFSMLELSQALRYPSVILNHIFIALGAGFLILIRLDYTIAVYIICVLNISAKHDSYIAGREHRFLLIYLRLSKFEILKYKLFIFVTMNLAHLLIYTVLYMVLIRDFNILTIMFLPIVLLNAFMQHTSLETIYAESAPGFDLSTPGFIFWWIISSLPIAAFLLYGRAIQKIRHLRHE